QELEKSGHQGSDHYRNAIDALVEFVGEQLVALIPHYDDTAGEIATRKNDDTTETVRVNDPAYHHPDTGEPSPMLDADLQHLVTISTGPNVDSERAEASDFADTMMGAQIERVVGPQKATEILALVVKLKNLGPIGDEMAEI